MASDPIRLNDAWLHQWCAEDADQVTPPRAYELAAGLKNLAIWWLRPEVLQQAVGHARKSGLEDAAQQWQRAPQLPTEAGACWIAVVNKHPDLGLLRQAYALPLRWAKQQDHDARLPAGLRALADQVRGQLERLREVDDTWRLLPGRDSLLYDLDLRTLEGRWDSAFASLAVGLLLAAWEGRPDPTLWANAAWDSEQGIQAVDCLEAKLKLAHDFQARRFFVPQPQADALRDWATKQAMNVEVRVLRSNVTDVRDALGEYLEEHELPIGPGPHRRCCPFGPTFRLMHLPETLPQPVGTHCGAPTEQGLHYAPTEAETQGGRAQCCWKRKAIFLRHLSTPTLTSNAAPQSPKIPTYCGVCTKGAFCGMILRVCGQVGRNAPADEKAIETLPNLHTAAPRFLRLAQCPGR